MSPLSLICLRRDKQRIHIPTRATRFKANYVITKDLFNSWERDYHLRDLEKILCKKSNLRSRYENNILTAIRWLGTGIHDDINSDAFLKLTIALECLILSGNDRSKSEALAERCAYLLGDNQEQRFILYDDVKAFYDIRSKIVHNGYDNISDEELDKFQMMVMACLFKIFELPIYDGIKETSDIIEWLKKQRFK